jgi:alpha-mannosidase
MSVEPEPTPSPAPATPEPAPAPEPTPQGRRLIALIPDDGREPAAGLADAEAEAAWAAASALWHPALLARSGRLPLAEDTASPSVPEPGDVRVVAAGSAARLGHEDRLAEESAGAEVVEGVLDRLEVARSVLARLDPDATLGDVSDPIALDFLALGTARRMLRDLTAAMGHADCLDAESLAREAIGGACAWAEGDRPGATNRLRAAFELLTQAREKFYPVDAYLVDLLLLDPSEPAGALAGALEARSPFTVLSPARGIDALASVEPAALAALRQAVDDGWADVAGGPFDESDEPLRPVESILWQYRQGARTYRAHLDGRSVETLARRRFGLYPMLPQIARRFAIRFAVHLGFDAGRFPLPAEAKRLWEAPDGTTVESLTRAPLAADRPAQGVRLPWVLARSMKDDHVATLPLLHWPSPLAGWYLDLRRVAAYSPVLARWVTLNDYFHLTDRPWDVFRPSADEYVTPYLSQAVARGDAAPISGRVDLHRSRARLDALVWLDAVSAALKPAAEAPTTAGPDELLPPLARFADVEEALETGRVAEAEGRLDALLPEHAARLARAIVGDGAGGRPGYLVFNPLAMPRRAAVLLPGASPGLPPEGPLRASQLTEEGLWGVVDLPGFGFAWVPGGPPESLDAPGRPGVSASGRVIRNEAVEVEFDEATGGLRGIRTPGEQPSRVGQQLVAVGLVSPDGQPLGSRMRGESFEVEYAGPALVQALSRGQITDEAERPVARFSQRVRLWTGRPTAELGITLDDLDPAFLHRLGRAADPWECFLACRWAWPESEAELRRTSLLAPSATKADRPETPDALEIVGRRRRTALLFGGLAHHRRRGGRMLDTLLVAGRESRRTFRLGVALDLEQPFHAALDLTAPTPVVPVSAGPPRTGPAGWFFHLDRPGVAVTRVEFTGGTDGRGPGLIVHLLETGGRATRSRFRVFRNPTWARQTDFQGDLIVDLPVEGDAVLVDLAPHELARVEITLG